MEVNAVQDGEDTWILNWIHHFNTLWKFLIAPSPQLLSPAYSFHRYLNLFDSKTAKRHLQKQNRVIENERFRCYIIAILRMRKHIFPITRASFTRNKCTKFQEFWLFLSFKDNLRISSLLFSRKYESLSILKILISDRRRTKLSTSLPPSILSTLWNTTFFRSFQYINIKIHFVPPCSIWRSN